MLHRLQCNDCFLLRVYRETSELLQIEHLCRDTDDQHLNVVSTNHCGRTKAVLQPTDHRPCPGILSVAFMYQLDLQLQRNAAHTRIDLAAQFNHKSITDLMLLQ